MAGSGDSTETARSDLRDIERTIRRYRVETGVFQVLAVAAMLGAVYATRWLGLWGLAIWPGVVAASVWRSRSNAGHIRALFSRQLKLKRQLGDLTGLDAESLNALDTEHTRLMSERLLWSVFFAAFLLGAVVLMTISGSWVFVAGLGGVLVATAIRIAVVGARIRRIRRAFAQAGVSPNTNDLHGG